MAHRTIGKIAGLALIGLLLAACAAQPLDTGRAAQYKRVGVLSAMGDTFMSGRVGITVFTTGGTQEHLDLGADEIMTAAATKALSARYQVVDLGKYRQAFMDTPKYWPGNQGIFADSRPSVPEVVRKLMGDEKLDAYILITPSSATVRGTNQRVGGIGLLKKEEFLRTGDVLLYAAYIVSVVDGTDFSLQADMRAYPQGESALGSLAGLSALSAPNWPVLPEYQADPVGNRDKLHDIFKTLIDQNMPQTLQQAHLSE